MKHLIEAGTDAAAVLLFDPGALPEDFDQRSRDDAADAVMALAAEGRGCYVETGGDGAYLLHLYVDEPLPDRLRPFAGETTVVDALQVPTGRLYFTGAEYGFREEAALLRKHPHMGNYCVIRPDVYRLTLTQLEYPEGLEEEQVRRELSPGEYRLRKAMEGLGALGCVSVLALAVSFLIRSHEPWLGVVRPVLVVLILLPWIVSRLAGYRAARERAEAVEREYPWAAAHLEPLSSLPTGV